MALESPAACLVYFIELFLGSDWQHPLISSWSFYTACHLLSSNFFCVAMENLAFDGNKLLSGDLADVSFHLSGMVQFQPLCFSK